MSVNYLHEDRNALRRQENRQIYKTETEAAAFELF